MANRVVITGLGVVTPIGHSCKEVLDNIYLGHSNFTPTTIAVNPRKTKTYPVGYVDDSRFDFIEPEHEKVMNKAAKFAYHAAKDALRGNNYSRIRHKCGVSIASTLPNSEIFSDSYEIQKTGDIFKSMNNSIAFSIANAFGFEGPCYSNSSACASGLQAIITGYKAIRDKEADLMICGGAEEYSNYLLKIFDKLGIAAKQHCKPCDLDRDGTIVSEGAGILVLESLQRAKLRNATIYAEIDSYGETFAVNNLAFSDKESIYKCMRKACKHSYFGWTTYVNMHATGTVLGDEQELEAIKQYETFRKTTSDVTFNLETFKEHLGHTMGASGAVELALSLYKHKDESLIKIIKNSFGLGGTNTTLVLGKYRW